MKRISLIILLTVINTVVFAQDSITLRDDAKFKYKIRKTLIPEYARLLNFISDNTNAQNEVDEAIRLRVNGTREQKIFTDSKVIIESDLKPGAETSNLLRGDMEVIPYLNSLNTNYTKSGDPTISLIVTSISPLKKTTYFYYNVLFDCNFSSTTINGEHYKTFSRVAEIKLVNDNGWQTYINGVRFPAGTELDSVNAYMNIISTDTSVADILRSYDNEEAQRLRNERMKIQALIDAGDDKFDSDNYEAALEKYREARMIDLSNKDAQTAIAKAKSAIAKKKEETLANKERENRIAELKKNLKIEEGNYNFTTAKILCDSLINDYKVSDEDIVQLNSELASLLSSLTAIEAALEHKNYKEAINKCEEKIKTAKNKNHRAEFYYQLAAVDYKSDKSSQKRILENLTNAIVESDKHHQRALKLRSTIYINNDERIKAIEDASQLINNDSRNAENYAFRAGIYERDNNFSKAIDDYEKAISLKSADKNIWLKKIMLEYKTGKYKQARKTGDDAIDQNINSPELFFYRGLAKEKLEDVKGAGEDFYAAKKYGIADSSKKQINTIAAGHLKTGNAFLQEDKTVEALNEFTNAVFIDSGETALYMRAKTLLMSGYNDSAVTVLNALIRINTNYKDAHAQRGLAYTRLQKYNDAQQDFVFETKKYPDNLSAFYNYGSLQIAQRIYGGATTNFEKVIALAPSDSAYHSASLAYYLNKNYSRAIEMSKKARDKNPKNYEIFYVCGKAYYDLGKYDDALVEFKKAKTLVPTNDEVLFWYARSLEEDKQYAEATASYDQFNSESVYKDSSIFRSGICLVKTDINKNYAKAVQKFEDLAESKKYPYKSEVYAWLAYAWLNMDDMSKANEAIENARKENENNARLQFVQACKYSSLKQAEEAFLFAEKAMASRAFKKSDFEEEPLLKAIARKDKFKSLLQKYFP